jgi:FlgN protein
MNAQVLITSLKAQEVNLDLLIEALEEQKYAILRNDFIALEEAIINEQKILKSISREETSILRFIKDIGQQFSLDLKDYSISNLILYGRSYFGKELFELEKVRASVRAKVSKTANINFQLKDVIEFSRNLMKETMMIIAGQNKHSLVNKRV